MMLAVLPFENYSNDSGQEYFSDGLTEETISHLGGMNPERMGVIARTSSMAYKRTSKSVREIGAELGVDYILESSVRREDNRVRITSQLIRVEDQTHIWTSNYDRDVTSVFAIQRELSTAIAQHVGLQLLPERLNALARRQTTNQESYDLHLRGRYLWNQLSAVTTKRAMEYYGRAVELDPDYALAWSGMADAYSASPVNADMPPLQVWPRARDAVAHGLASGPGLPEVHTSLGLLKFWLDWDWVAADAAFCKSIEIDPGYSLACRFRGIVLSHLARHEEASQSLRLARDLDPLNATNHALSAQVAFAAREYSVAVQFAQQAITIDPEFWIGYIQLAQAFEQTGNSDLALDALIHAGRFSGGNSKAISIRGYVCARIGKTKEAHEVLDTLEAVSRDRYVPPYATALVYLGLGKHDAALHWLERAYDAHDVHLVFLPVDPKWDPLRADARFDDLLQRCRFTSRPPHGS